MTGSLSLPEARKLVLLSQRLPPGRISGESLNATLSAIEHLGYIQIDTISVVQRAHHHTLWNRNPNYQIDDLDQLTAEKKIFEYWSHAAAFLPMRDFRHSLPRKNAIASGKQENWYDRDPALMKSVLKRISQEGPLMARDFEHSKRKANAWGSKPAKQALESLFMQGDLMISKRVGFQKVYELTERVLPDGLDTSTPTPEENARFLVTRYLEANGLGRLSEITYLLKNIKAQVAAVLPEMISGGEIVPIRIKDQSYYALPSSLELLNLRLARRKLKILSPFDNLLIQRQRMRDLFDYDYLIECYLPAAKRQHGYFSLPILWDGRLVARMDCKADRKNSLLNIHHLALESSVKDFEAFTSALRRELNSFLLFNKCDHLSLHKTSPSHFKHMWDFP